MEKKSQKTGGPSAELREETPFHKAAPGTQVRREAVYKDMNKRRMVVARRLV